MNRRNFLKNSSLAGLAFAPFSGAVLTKPEQENENQGDNDSFPLLETSIDELQQKMRNGVYTSRSLTELYLKRISSIDKSGPSINAVIEVNPDALLIAAQMDAERKSGKVRGPLHGIPVLIKDNIDTADKM